MESLKLPVLRVGNELKIAARQIVHAAAPTARPIAPVLPAMIILEPIVEREQRIIDFSEPVFVSVVLVILPLAPRHYLGSRARRVVAIESVNTV